MNNTSLRIDDFLAVARSTEVFHEEELAVLGEVLEMSITRPEAGYPWID